jgi:hypothetical protein
MDSSSAPVAAASHECRSGTASDRGCDARDSIAEDFVCEIDAGVADPGDQRSARTHCAVVMCAIER